MRKRVKARKGTIRGTVLGAMRSGVNQGTRRGVLNKKLVLAARALAY